MKKSRFTESPSLITLDEGGAGQLRPAANMASEKHLTPSGRASYQKFLN